MNRLQVMALGCVVFFMSTASAQAARVEEKRENAAYVVTGKVMNVYMAGTEEHASFIVEIKVDEVAKGDKVKKGDTFRASVYQNKTTSLQWDSHGHKIIPKPGDRVRVYVKDDHGRNEGIYPDWIDVLETEKK